MKKNILLFILLISSHSIFFAESDTQKYVIGCHNWGLFAELLWTLNHLEYCLKTEKTPVILWNHGPYYEKNGYNGGTDVWTYYFEPTSNLAYEPNDIIHNNNFPRGKENFTTIYEKYADAIENPSFPTKELRIWTKKNLIDRFVKPKKSLIKKIESFYQENMAGCHIIGVHLRGKHIWNEVKYPQLQEIFDEANRHASPQSKFFVATDQKILLNEAKKNLKGPVIYYDCYRMDEDSTSNVLWGKHLPINYSKARLGEDVLIEVSLLSRCDVMIHTISCVSLAASYFNPELHGVRLYYEKNLLKKFSF